MCFQSVPLIFLSSVLRCNEKKQHSYGHSMSSLDHLIDKVVRSRAEQLVGVILTMVDRT